MLVASGAFFLTRVRMHRRVCERIRRQKREAHGSFQKVKVRTLKKQQTSPLYMCA